MDALVRALNENRDLRIVSAITTEMVKEACHRQGASGAEAIALGRALTSGALLATLAKRDKERVRIRIDGGGRSGALMVDSYGDGRGRACFQYAIDPDDDASRVYDLRGRVSCAVAVGIRGHVVVTRDLGLQTPYQGTVELQNGEVDEDLEHYLNQSEQLPSALTCGVVLGADQEVIRAGGVLVQGIPGSDPRLIDEVRERFERGALHDLLRNSRKSEQLVAFALGGNPYKVMGVKSLRFHCPCGPQRAVDVLATLGPEDLEQLAQEQEITEVTCNFCGDTTQIAADQVRELAHQLRATLS